MRRILRLLLAASLLLAALSFLYPLFVMMPFRAQSTRELLFSLSYRKWAPAIATMAAAASLLLTVRLWSASGRVQRLLAMLASAATVVFAALSYLNIYEMVFHGVRSPEFVAAAEAKIDPDDMVLSVGARGEARAYPIRMLGYHHMVNDRISGVAVAATY
jgi:hypothetical protein